LLLEGRDIVGRLREQLFSSHIIALELSVWGLLLESLRTPLVDLERLVDPAANENINGLLVGILMELFCKLEYSWL
jgi:hypothetical protein